MNQLRLLPAFLAIVAATLSAHPARSADQFPVFHADDTVLFQGDSITDGGRQRTGSDFNHIMGQDYAYIIAAQVGADLPERGIIFMNRGIGGNRVTDLAARWQTDTLDIKPNFLSILIGINDLMIGGANHETVETYEATYDKLLSDTLAALPNIRIVLGQPFVLPVGNQAADYDAHRKDLAAYQQVVERLGRKYHLPIVHYQEAFDAACRKVPAAHWSWDGIHPTYAGHGLMAKEWLATVNKFWPKG